MKTFWEDFINIVIKTLIPAFVAVSLSIAVQMKRTGTMSWTTAILSYIIGLSCAFLSGFVVHEHLSQGSATLAIGIIAITGEKVGYWLVYTLSLDEALNDFFKWAREKLKRMFG